jgi:hypothetical protein
MATAAAINEDKEESDEESIDTHEHGTDVDPRQEDDEQVDDSGSDDSSIDNDRSQQGEMNDIDTSLLTVQSLAIAEEKARARVRRQLDEQKRKNGKKGAFRSRNSNKTYVKGKRVMNDVGY